MTLSSCPGRHLYCWHERPRAGLVYARLDLPKQRSNQPIYKKQRHVLDLCCTCALTMLDHQQHADSQRTAEHTAAQACRGAFTSVVHSTMACANCLCTRPFSPPVLACLYCASHSSSRALPACRALHAHLGSVRAERGGCTADFCAALACSSCVSHSCGRALPACRPLHAHQRSQQVQESVSVRPAAGCVQS